MERKTVRPVFVWGAVIVLSLALVLLAAGGLSRATAQEHGETWTSSAEAPAGTPLESYSLADSPAAIGQDESQLAPDALVSWRVIGSALKPRENDVSYTVGSNGSCTYVTAGDASTVWNFAPDLPQGANVETLRMYYYDTSGSNTSAWFTVYDLYGEIVQEWSVSSIGNSGNGFNDSTTINHTIDYSVYAYLLNWRPIASGSTLQLCGFRVFFTPPPFGLQFLPAIQKVP